MSNPLDYHTPQPKTPEAQRVTNLRIMAGALAIGSTLWGLFCALFILFGNSLAILIFGPGYLVMAGYYWRAFGRPSAGWCHAIWGLSLLVQGAWLCLTIVGVFIRAIESANEVGTTNTNWMDGLFPLVAMAWWTVAFVVSFIALRLEPSQ